MKSPLPDALMHGPFTRSQALAAGLTPKLLRSKHVRRLLRNVYLRADAPITRPVMITASHFVLPADAAVSHATALHCYGVGIGPEWPLHFSTNTSVKTVRAEIVLHRRRGTLHPVTYQGYRILGPDRTLVDCGTMLSVVELVQAADWLIHLKHTTLEQLIEYANARHLDGVRRVRRILRLASAGVESPRETVVRLMLVCARLPKPDCNPQIFAGARFVARCDLVYHAYRVIVEYDGWQHERDARQRQRDRVRLEELAALGWTVIVVTAADLVDKPLVVQRVHRALVANGYKGPQPVLNVMWHRWFA